MSPERELASKEASGRRCWNLSSWGGMVHVPGPQATSQPGKLWCFETWDGPSEMTSPFLLCCHLPNTTRPWVPTNYGQSETLCRRHSMKLAGSGSWAGQGLPCTTSVGELGSDLGENGAMIPDQVASASSTLGAVPPVFVACTQLGSNKSQRGSKAGMQ